MPNARPALLSVIALMFLLLPLLLLTTSAQKLVGLDLHMPGTGELPPEMPGTVEGLEVLLGEAIVVRARVRRSDVVTSSGEVETREIRVQDLASLQATLRSFKDLDPEQRRVLLLPEDEVSGAHVVATMDALRSDSVGELFPQVALGAAR